MASKKILFLNCTLGCGGIERSLCNILRYIDFEKYSVDLYLDSTDGILLNQVPKSVRIIVPNMDDCYGRVFTILIKLIKNREFGRLWLRVIKKMVDCVGYSAYRLAQPLYWKYGKYDCVIAYKEGNITQFAMRAFRYSNIVGWWHRGVVSSDTSEYTKYLSLDKIVPVSEGAYRVMESMLHEVSHNSVIINNMVDVMQIQESANAIENPYQKKKLHLVTVARLSPEKHLDNIIPCAQKLIDAKLDFQWHIVGGGLLLDQLHDLITSNQLESNIILEGEQENPYPYIRYADLYVHTSYIESQGLTILEAMALGVPCVVTKSLGPCEFIQDGVNGILSEQSAESLAEKVQEILTDSELYHRIRKNTYCPEQFKPEKVIGEFEKLLEALI